MSIKHQLRLTLWKDYLIRKRNIGMLSMVFLYATAIFSINSTVRLFSERENIPTCQFPARVMPSAGLLPFVQNFICNINNECVEPNEHGAIVDFETTTTGALVSELQPLLTNQTFGNITKNLPKTLQFISALADILNNKDIKRLTTEGVQVRHLLKNINKLEHFVVNDKKLISNFTFHTLIDSNVNLIQLMLLWSRDELKVATCNPEMLDTLLISSEDIEDISKELCYINQIGDEIFSQLWDFVDLGQILRLIGKSLIPLGHNDLFSDIGLMIDASIRLQESPLFKKYHTTYINFTLLEETIESFNPLFDTMQHGNLIKKFAMDLAKILDWVQEKMLHQSESPVYENTGKVVPKTNSTVLYNNLRVDMVEIYNLISDKPINESFKKILNMVNRTGVMIENLVENPDKFSTTNLVQFFDDIKFVFPYEEEIVDKTVILNRILRLLNSLISINTEGENIIHDVFEKHKSTIETFVSLGPNVGRQLVQALSDRSKINIFLNDWNNPSIIFCDISKLQRLLTVDKNDLKNVKKVLCTKKWNSFLKDLTNELKFSDIENSIQSINNQSSLFKTTNNTNEADKSLVQLYKSFRKLNATIQKNFNETENQKKFDWMIINPSLVEESWKEVLEEFIDQIKYKIVLNLIENQAQSSPWFTYTSIILDISNKLSSSLKENFIRSEKPAQFFSIEPHLDLIGFSLQHFITREFVLKKHCEKINPNNRKEKFFLDSKDFVCPFEYDRMEKSFKNFFENSAKVNNFTLESSLRNLVDNMKFLVKKNLSDPTEWEVALNRSIPHNYGVNSSKEWTKFLLDTYRKNGVSQNLMQLIDREIQGYTDVLNGFKGDIKFIPHTSQEDDETSTFDDIIFSRHIIGFQSALRHLIKNPRLFANLMDQSEIDLRLNEIYAEPERGVEMLQMFSEQIFNSDFLQKENESCLWCRFAVVSLTQIAQQVQQGDKYLNLVCRLEGMNFTQLYHKIMDEFGWRNVGRGLQNKTELSYTDFKNSLHNFFEIFKQEISEDAASFAQAKVCVMNLKNSTLAVSFKSYYNFFMDMMGFLNATKGQVTDFLAFESIFDNRNKLLQIGDNLAIRKSFNSSQNLDFLNGVLQLVQNSTLENLKNGVEGIITSLKPVGNNSEIERDLTIVLKGLDALANLRTDQIFKSKYKVSEVFLDWSKTKSDLEKYLRLSPAEIQAIYDSDIDIKTMLDETKNLIDIEELICDPKRIDYIFKFSSSASTKIIDSISRKLCSLDLNEMQIFFDSLKSQVDIMHVMSPFFKKVIDHVIVAANLSREDGEKVVADIQVASTFVDALRSAIGLFKEIPSEKLVQNQSKPFDVSEISNILCGKPFVQEKNIHFSEIKAKSFQNYDRLELNSMPTEFCKSLYKNITQMSAGNILWAFVKPILRGKILYTPNTRSVRRIITAANGTFQELAEIEKILEHIIIGVNSFDDLSKTNRNFDNLKETLKNPALKTMFQSLNIAPIDLNFNSFESKYQNSERLTIIVNYTRDFLQCVRIDRFVGVENEQQLEIEAQKLLQNREFIAGVVFNNEELKQALDELPNNIEYKIRMDGENVPSTKRLRDQFWKPGAEANFFLNLQYLRGFIQLQDMIDQALIDLQGNYSGNSNEKWPEIYTQQFPYPCYIFDQFMFTFTASQGGVFAFMVSLMMYVGSTVRFAVWERENKNTIMMKVMGLKYWIQFTSWFFTSFIEMLITMTLIFIVNIIGQVTYYSNLFLVFLFMLNYGFSVIMFSYMISTFWKTASAGSITGIMLYILTYMPFIIVLSLESQLEFWQRILINLFMSSSLGQGVLNMLRFEIQGTGIQWSNMWTSPIKNDPMNFGISFVLCTVDGILYAIIGLCVEKFRSRSTSVQSQLETQEDSEITSEVGVHIKNITKIYKAGKRTKVALKNINLELYKGQVTALLGHNGAGKTTLINILTGLMPPTSGNIFINDDRYANVKTKQQYLGVCPQFSIVWDSLTSREHLIFYAQLKTNLPKKYIEDDVQNMLDSMGLGHLENEPVSTLSEGTRRRLSVAIAFIGNPTLVVLDEPSSGVDPVARRQIWELIINHKTDRTVLITTHHFDEAELLSDRIIILHRGEVHCSGTPLSLKHNYGKGYQLVVIYPEKTEYGKAIDKKVSNTLLSTVREVIPNAYINEITDRRVDIELPFVGENKEANDFEKAAFILEERQSTLGFECFSFNCVTLEKVFQDICAEADSMNEVKPPTPVVETKVSNGNKLKETKVIVKADNSPARLGKEMKPLLFKKENTVRLTAKWYQQILPLLRKRFLHCILDRKILLCVVVLPILIISIAMAFYTVRPPNEDDPPLEISKKLYQENSITFLAYNIQRFSSEIGENLIDFSNSNDDPIYSLYNNYSSINCQCIDNMQHCPQPFPPMPKSNFTLFHWDNETIQWLLETEEQYIEQRYGGWSVRQSLVNPEKEKIIVWFNNKGYHALPSFINALTNAILKTKCSDCNITIINHPLSLSQEDLGRSTPVQQIAEVGVTGILLLAYTLVPCSVVIYLVQERLNEEKRLQILCGVTPLMYWMVSFIWDFTIHAIVVGLGVIVFEIFQLPLYVSNNNIYANVILLLLYGWAMIPLMYLFEKAFKETSSAFMIAYGVSCMVGLVTITPPLLMEIFARTQFVLDLRNILRRIFLIFPPFVLPDALLLICKNDIQAQLLSRYNMDSYLDPLGWDLLGVHFLVLFSFGLVAFMTNLLIENYYFFRNKKNTAIPTGKYLLETIRLRKVFRCVDGKKVAVDSLSLQVPAGQCFGLLGVNGAGKSTTFRMLTTEIIQTSGQILIENKDIGTGPLCSGQLGYCPQSNAMDPKLTTVQNLRFYAELKGLTNKQEAINKSIEQFNLEMYRHVRFEALSGGNKRKICAAVAVLGRAPVILMDEPTSGMDPNARDVVGNVIEQITKQNRSVILTSHSMEECEMLCSQVAIMIKGKIKCKGPPALLKSRFGGGYLLSIRLQDEYQKEALNRSIMSNFPNSSLQNQQYCSSQFLIPTERILTSDIFKRMKAISTSIDIVDYSIVQSSLDQVFINLVQAESENSTEPNGTNNIKMKPITKAFRDLNTECD